MSGERYEIPDPIRRVWFTAHMRVTWSRDIGPGLRKAARAVGRMPGRNPELELDADTEGTLGVYLRDEVAPWLRGCLASIEDVTKDLPVEVSR